MTTGTDHSVTLTRLISADPATVFKALTDAEQMKRWSAPEGVECKAIAVDLKVGGAYRITMRAPDGEEFNAIGTYREITPPSRVVYTWRWEERGDSEPETLVTIDLKARGDATELLLTHTGFADAEEAGKHNEGWVSCVNRLEAVFA